MAENRRFYYLKLKEGFYNSETMVVLESMPDGLLYSNLLLKMYLMSLKSGGILMLNEHLPHTVQTIATFTRHQIGTVERAIKVFMEFGLVEVLTDGAFYMADIQLLIGQSSTEGERKKRERSRLQRQKLLPSGKVDICPPIDPVDKCPPILEIRDKEYRDQSIENREGNTPARLAVTKMFFCLLVSCPNCKPTSPLSGRNTLSVCPSTWPPRANSTAAMPPPFAAG